jgi:hypothetical protein
VVELIHPNQSTSCGWFFREMGNELSGVTTGGEKYLEKLSNSNL